jgi:two-component system chemotaxis response regulator CheB
MKKVHVLIVDDSAVVRQILREILSSDDGIEVVGTAADPYVAREKIKKLCPDVITLDVEMPKMDGISFLRNLMRLRPMPVIMVSSLTEEGADIALEALGLGAVDYVSKPKVDVAENLVEYSQEIIDKVKAAASAKINQPGSDESGDVVKDSVKHEALVSHSTTTVLQKSPVKKSGASERVIAIGASTGGTEAIKEILVNMKADSPAMVITQHIPRAFSTAFARRMNTISSMLVGEARHGEKIKPGHVYIAPGDQHLMLEKKAGEFYCVLDDGDPVNRHKPSVDVLFRSVAQTVGSSAIGIILTGMGADGARGLGEMREMGAITMAQDEQSSVVWGMPGAAVKLNVVDHVMPLNNMANKLTALLRE